MTNTTAGVLRKRGHLALLGALALLVMLPGPTKAVSQTAIAAYQECMLEAGVEANNCYMNADGYFQNRACDIAWDINKLACIRALGRAIGI